MFGEVSEPGDPNLSILIQHWVEVSAAPFWSTLRQAIVSLLDQETHRIADRLDSRLTEAMQARRSETARSFETESQLRGVLHQLQEELRAAQSEVARLAQENSYLKTRIKEIARSSVPDSPDPSWSAAPSAGMPRRFDTTEEGVCDALRHARNRIREAGPKTNDDRKVAFVEELKRLLPSAEGHIYTAESDNVIFIRRIESATSAWPGWFLVVNGVSQDEVGPLIDPFFQSMQGGPARLQGRRFEELDVVQPAIIPADVEFKASDPYRVRDFVKIERVRRGVIRVGS